MREWVASLAGGDQRRFVVLGASLLAMVAVVVAGVAVGRTDPEPDRATPTPLASPAEERTSDDRLLHLLLGPDAGHAGDATDTARPTDSTVPLDPAAPLAPAPSSVAPHDPATGPVRGAPAADAPPPEPQVTLPPITTAPVPVTVPVPVPTTLAPPPPPAPGRDAAAEGTLASAFARHRSASGLPAVSRHGGLDDVAARWAAQLADRGQLAHNPNAGSQILAACGGCTGWAENVGMHESVQGVWTSFLGSGSHRANLDDRSARSYGLAVVARGGLLWVVHVFGRA